MTFCESYWYASAYQSSIFGRSRTLTPWAEAVRGAVPRFVALGLELSLYIFDATTETFAAIRRYRPAWVLTSEARLLRRWVSNELQ